MGNKFAKGAVLKAGEIDIGHYRVMLTDDIGSGSFGTVYQATNRKTGEKLAVKKIKYEFGTKISEELKDMAESEAESMKAVQHPNIVSLLDCAMAHHSAWLFMPFCDRGDLSHYLSKNVDMPIGKRFILMHQMAEAVSCLHGNSPPIIHRDIKPGNVLIKNINGEDCAMLTDFGFAKIYDYNMSIAGSLVYHNYHESLKGTPSFMAPEFFMEDPTGLKYTATVDIFSLGLVNSVILEYSSSNRNVHPLSVKAKKENKEVNFGFEMSECYKRSNDLPVIVQHEENDSESVHELKEMLLRMTAFHDNERPHIEAVTEILMRIQLRERIIFPATNSLALNLIDNKLRQVKTVKTSDLIWSIKYIGDEIWCCKKDCIAVYDDTLDRLRHMELGRTSDAFLLSQGHIVIARFNGLKIVSNSGQLIRKISSKAYRGVAVHGDKCYACPFESAQIDVYTCSDWQLLRTIQLPGCNADCLGHTIIVSSQHIKLCCWDTHRLIILNLDGKVKSIHGPEIDIIDDSHEAASRGRTVKSRLRHPRLCQDDDDGNVLIVDCVNDRLLVFTAEFKWHDVTPEGGLKYPFAALWLTGRLYVSSWSGKSITMFE